MSSGTSNTCVLIKNGFLRKYDANVFIMDWSRISGNIFYPAPMKATSDVGDYYGEFLKRLIADGLDPSQIHLVGHSLGAHVSGFAARRIKHKRKIARITGIFIY